MRSEASPPNPKAIRLHRVRGTQRLESGNARDPHRCRGDLRFNQMSGQQLSASNFLATVDAAAREFIQSGIVTVL